MSTTVKIEHPHITELKRAGYICLPMKPMMWKVRGPEGTLEIYPFVGKLKRSYSDLVEYTDPVAAVTSIIMPYEPIRTPEQESLLSELLDRLECIRYVIHMRRSGGLATE